MDFIKPGEVTRTHVVFSEEDRARRLWMRACNLAAFGEPHPLGPSARLGNGIVITYLLHTAGLPAWLIQHFRRSDSRHICAELLIADLAREDQATAKWFDGLMAQMPRWHDAEPKGEPEFQVPAAWKQPEAV